MPISAAAEVAAQPAALLVEGLELAYPSPDGRRIEVLSVPTFTLAQGALLGITGPSGSGKTSLLNVLSGIERPSAGHIRWGDVELTAASESARDAWRRRTVGLVFQDFHLMPGLSIRANVLLPLQLDHFSVPQEARARADSLIAEVGLAEPERKVELLSRGEQQRTAVARALVRRPRLLFADEPTASLDAVSGAAVGDLLVRLARESGATLIVVSHDAAMLGRLDRVCRLTSGHLEAGA